MNRCRPASASVTRRSKRLLASASGETPVKKKKITGSTLAVTSTEYVETASSPANDEPLYDTKAVDFEDDNLTESLPERKQKGKKKEVEAEPRLEDFPPRFQNNLFIGAHVSAAGGPHNAVINAAKIGANAFALFLKSQRKWTSPPLSSESITLFKLYMKTLNYTPQHVLPHGSYLINLANPDPEKRQKSYDCFLDDLKRCEQLGLNLYNFHPGSAVGSPDREKSLSHIAECINRAHSETSSVVTVLENTAGAGSTLGKSFSDLATIISQVTDKSRIGVCLDTWIQHQHKTGNRINPYVPVIITYAHDQRRKQVLDFDRTIGLSYLLAFHVNDAKPEATLGSHKDRHENIGLGNIGLPAFHSLLNSPLLRTHFKTRHIPLILETPIGPSKFEDKVWKTEISILNRLSGFSSIAEEDDELQKDEQGDEDKNDFKAEKMILDLLEEIRTIVGTRPVKDSKGDKVKVSMTKRRRRL